MINTPYGPAEILSPAHLADGSPGYYVIMRRKDATAWPFKGVYVYLIVPTESESEK